MNKKTLNYPPNQNQNDMSSETKSYTNNSERNFTSQINQQKSDKNGVKSLLNDSNSINLLSNGIPLTQKLKKKSTHSAHNEINKLNSKSIEDYENNSIITNQFYKKEMIKNKNNEILDNTLLKLKKLQNSISNIHSNGNFDSNNRIISAYSSNNNFNEPKRKKNYSLNYNKDTHSNSNTNINIITNLNANKSRDQKNELEYDYLYNSNKINEKKKKNFIRENNNNKELSRLIQENFNFNFHRRFNNYTDFNKSNKIITNEQNLTANPHSSNSIDYNCNFTEHYKRDNEDVKDEFFQTTKTCDEDDKNDLIKSNKNINARKNDIFNNNVQKKKFIELQLKLDMCNKELKKLENIQKTNYLLEKKNEDLQYNLNIAKKRMKYIYHK